MSAWTRSAVLLAGGLALSAVAGDAPPPSGKEPTPSQLGEQAKKRAKDYKFNFEIPKVENPEHVKSVAEQGRKRGAAELERMAAERQRQDALAAGKKPEDVEKQAPLAGRVVVAVSASMPETMLRDYLVQMDGVREGMVIMRGFVGGSQNVVKPTGALFERVSRMKPSDPRGGHRATEVSIDPLLFRDLGIDQVPAVAWLPGVTDVRHCDREVFKATTVVFGGVSVEAALREINRNGGDVPEAVIKKFRGKGWEQSQKK